MIDQAARSEDRAHETRAPTPHLSGDAFSPFESDPQGAPAPWMAAEVRPIQRMRAAVQRQSGGGGRITNKTGLPDHVKAGVEHLSGMNLDHVKVHYNSAKPAQLNAHAYAQGNEIHMAPGQERHVAHEAWHVVQQAQGRVQPTTQFAGRAPGNADPALEAEATAMAKKAEEVGKDLIAKKGEG